MATTSPTSPTPIILPFFEKVTATWSYIVADPQTHEAAIIDSVLDFDPATMTATTASADVLLKAVTENNLTVVHILETHTHADHLTASSYLQDKLLAAKGIKVPIGIGRRVSMVQAHYGKQFDIPAAELENAFDNLWDDEQAFKIGALTVVVMHLPGHTPDHIGYKIGPKIFCGDSIFNPDVGSARADFPGGSADDLWHSGRSLVESGDSVEIYVGHDYPPPPGESDGKKRDPCSSTTANEQRLLNKHFKDGTLKEEFVKMRHDRDQTLSEPRLMKWSLQVNVRAGRLPPSIKLVV